MTRLLRQSVLALSLLGSVTAAANAEQSQQVAELNDVVAMVGDQSITFGQINTMLNSSAVVGLSLPALGTPERDRVRILLLDRVVSANLLYLDALKRGVDKDPGYQRDLKRFSDRILAGLYRRQHMVGDVAVSDEEIQEFYDTRIMPGTKMTDDLRTQIEASLRLYKQQQIIAEARESLRDGIDVVINEDNISALGQDERPDSAIAAKVGGDVITWGEVKQQLISADQGVMMTDALAMDDDARLPALQREIDLHIMTSKAYEAGLDKDNVHLARLNEYRKTHLINTHRGALAKAMMPSEEALKAYYDENRDSIAVPEYRKVQEVVLPTREQALDVKAKIEAGDITMYEAARDYSIAPGAKQNLGEIGWVTHGKPLPAMNDVVFFLDPGEIGGPVETPAGWHLVTVLDVKAAEHMVFEEERTRTLTLRRYMREKINDYVANLRQNDFNVEVYEDNLIRLAQAEADMVKALAEKAAQPGSITEQRIEELGKYLKP